MMTILRILLINQNNKNLIKNFKIVRQFFFLFNVKKVLVIK